MSEITDRVLVTGAGVGCQGAEGTVRIVLKLNYNNYNAYEL